MEVGEPFIRAQIASGESDESVVGEPTPAKKLDTILPEAHAVRIRVACQQCVKAKVRCDNNRPCGRCESRRTQDQCHDRPTREPGVAKQKHKRLRGGRRACLSCIQRKIACDTSRPCLRCREWSNVHRCIDRATVVDLGSPLMQVALTYETPSQKVSRVPRELKSVWLHGFRSFPPIVILDFLKSRRTREFLSSALKYIDMSEGATLLQEMHAFASSTSSEGSDSDADAEEGNPSFSTTPSKIPPPLSADTRLPIFHLKSVYLPFGHMIVACSMNEQAQSLWGYSNEFMMSSLAKTASDGVISSQFRQVAILWKFWHISCWPTIAQLLLKVWLAGESLHELQLCATRRDFKLVHMQTRWIFHLTETGTWDGAVVIAKPL